MPGEQVLHVPPSTPATPPAIGLSGKFHESHAASRAAGHVEPYE